MGSIGGDDRTAHMLVIPDNSQGHTIPMLTFTKELARKGVIITFVAYDDTISSLTSEDLSSELQRLDFRFIRLRNSGGKETDTPVQKNKRQEEAFKPVFQKLVHDKSSGVAGPTSILSDMFFNWAQDVADTLQIPRYLFVPSGAILARFMQGFLDLYTKDRIQISETDGKLVKFDGSVCIPGLPPMKYHEFPISARVYSAEYVVRCQKMWRTAGVVVNSCYEVEEQAIDLWRSPGTPGFEQRKVPKIYPVGPLFSTSVNVPSIIKGNGLEDSAAKSLRWLGSQPSTSVVYVAFGTRAHLSPGQINELAHGLEASNQRFLWVIPQSKISSEEETWTSVTDVLPPDFEGRVGDRGCFVTGWAPQLQILAHSSTAVFLTHSGWNSSFESITRGVPMIAWPQSAEQHLNCRYLTDHSKIADELQTRDENILDRKEVERAVRLLMVEPEGKAMRRRVEELQRKVAGAVREGGSQSTTFEEFVHDLFSRVHP